LRFGGWVLLCGMELRGDEHLVAWHPALAQPLTDALLVAVRLRRVDVPVSELERRPHRADALRPVRNLPDAEPEHRDLVAVSELARASVRRHWAGRHGRLLASMGCASNGFTTSGEPPSPDRGDCGPR